MRKIKYLALLMSLTTVLTILSVGFSAWMNLKPASYSLTGPSAGKLTAFAVNRSTDFISQESISIFNYSAFSFTKGGSPVDSGSVTVNYKINLKAYCAANGIDSYTSLESIVLDFSLTHENTRNNTALFTATAGKTIEVFINGSKFTGTVNNSGNLLSLRQTLNLAGIEVDANGCFTIPVEYRFTIAQASFRSLFGQFLLNGVSATDSDGNPTKLTTTFITAASISSSVTAANS